ncbi:HNH endonuclease [bacterium]|nr:HNH endonuclease [bacterium]
MTLMTATGNKLITRTELEKLEGKKIWNMHFGKSEPYSVVLMSVQDDSPYDDRKLENGVIVYQGHDNSEILDKRVRKASDQSLTRYGKQAPNGEFFSAAKQFEEGRCQNPRVVKIYEKIGTTYWTSLGFYSLTKARFESNGTRKVFNFWLTPNLQFLVATSSEKGEDHNRLIPREVKQYVMFRDNGRCVACSSATNIQFDHIIPFSQGGTSLNQANIQILCAECNQKKGNTLMY